VSKWSAPVEGRSSAHGRSPNHLGEQEQPLRATRTSYYTPTLREPENRACESVPRRFQLFHDPSRLS